MLLTKHCSPEVRDWMLNGQFKIGSHIEYSKGLTSGALSDTAEGNGGFFVKGNLHNFSGQIGSITFKNVSSIGNMNAIAVEDNINSLMFCASIGAYDRKRHEAIINGDLNQSYDRNPNYTAYLTLDAGKLGAALKSATDEFFGTQTYWVGIPVQYGERYENIDASDFRGFSGPDLMARLTKQASLKPKKFALEEEFRFLMAIMPSRPLPEAIFTMNLSAGVQKLFKYSILDTGDVQSPSIA